MSEKPDLISLFGVQGMITSGEKTLLTETDADLGNKTPYDITQDIKKLVDMLNQYIYDGDLENAFKCIQAISIRNTAVLHSIISINEMINIYMIKRSEDDDDAA